MKECCIPDGATPMTTIGMGDVAAPNGDEVGSGDTVNPKRKRKMKALQAFIKEKIKRDKLDDKTLNKK